VAFALSSPPTNLYPAVVLGLALLAFAIADEPSFWRAFGRGAAWGTAAGVVGLRFVPPVIQRFTPLGAPVSYLSLVLLAAGQSLVWAIGAGVSALLQRRARAPLELSFGAGVFVAVSLPAIFAWTPAGLLSPWPALVQLADLIGERGVSVLVAVGAALLARAALPRWGRTRPQTPGSSEALPASRRRVALRAVSAAAALFAAMALHGVLRMAAIEKAAVGLPTLSVALIDQAVGPLERWDSRNHPAILKTLRRLTEDAERQGVDLTVWPEAAYPYALDHELRRTPRGPMGILGPTVHGPLLFGVITNDRVVEVAPGVVERDSFNSATLLLPDGTLEPTYDKLQLLWFGEMVPLGAELPWLRRAFQRGGGLVPGTEPRALELPGPSPVSIGVLNCYEDTLSSVGRRIAALRPGLLVNVTNDAWFSGTAEPELHARLAAMRAVELRLDLVRAVNLGVASWVDARGVVRARDDSPAAGMLLVTPALRDGSLTLFARAGNAPVAALLVLAVAGFAWRSRRRPEPPGPTS
jgi:apolipoprotein N-acyltransferase